MTDKLNDYLEEIQEAKSTSVQRVGREEKISRAVGSLAIQKAKKENDSLYKQFKKYRDLYKKYKDKIVAKYGSRVKAQARK